MNMNEEKIKDILSVTIEELTDKDNIKTITFTGMDEEVDITVENKLNEFTDTFYSIFIGELDG